MANAPLLTERLCLRPLTLDDANDLLVITGDPIAMQYYPAPKTREESDAWLQRSLDCFRNHDGLGLWAIEQRETGTFLGVAGIVPQDVEGTCEYEIGYLLQRRHWGRGFATEAASAWLHHGLHERNFSRLVSLIGADNTPSRRVAERLGMRIERTVTMWGLTLDLWVKEPIGTDAAQS